MVSGLEEVEKKDSLDAVSGVKLTEKEVESSIPEAIKDGRNEAGNGTEKVPQADICRDEIGKPDVILGETKDSGTDKQGAGDNRGSVLPMGSQEQEGTARITDSSEKRTSSEELCGRDAITG